MEPTKDPKKTTQTTASAVSKAVDKLKPHKGSSGPKKTAQSNPAPSNPAEKAGVPDGIAKEQAEPKKTQLDLSGGLMSLKTLAANALETNGVKTLELCRQLVETIQGYGGKKKEIRAQLMEVLQLTANQLSRMEDVGGNEKLFSGVKSLPSSIFSLKQLVKIHQKDAALFAKLKPHLSDQSQSSAIKAVYEALKEGKEAKTALMAYIEQASWPQFLNKPYKEITDRVYAVAPLVNSLLGLLKKQVDQIEAEDPAKKEKARKKAIEASFGAQVEEALKGFLDQLVKTGALARESVEEEAGELKRYLTEVFAKEREAALGKVEKRLEKLDAKAEKAKAKEQKKAAKKVEKEAKEAAKNEPFKIEVGRPKI
ncbi:MAG: hypothetical protein RRB13_03395 [bacterium]|nr:hypothetical protein [bacterium]